MRSLLCLLTVTASPSLACPPPPPGIEVVANDKATIDPGGGLILRIDRDFANRNTDPTLVLHADGAPTEFTREYVTWNLSVLKPKARGKKLEVLRGGRVINTLQVVASPALAAPKLVRVSSTAPRPPKGPTRAQMYPPTAQIKIELGSDTPTDAFTLVVYKLEAAGARGVAATMPDAKHLIIYSTGGKQCMGGSETLYPGETIAVAWLDVHGKLSPRSQTITVTSAKP